MCGIKLWLALHPRKVHLQENFLLSS
jgi:hypothetical protein